MATVFDDCTTPEEVNETYKREFRSQNCANDKDAYWILSSDCRDAHQRLVEQRHKRDKLDSLLAISTADAPAPLLVREWAREQGITVGSRGRLDPSLVEAYIEAHGGAGDYDEADDEDLADA